MARIVSTGYSFDDVLVVPKYNKVRSRSDVNFRTRVTRNYWIDIPIVAANSRGTELKSRFKKNTPSMTRYITSKKILRSFTPPPPQKGGGRGGGGGYFRGGAPPPPILGLPCIFIKTKEFE